MKKYLLFDDLNYLEINLDTWNHPIHNHDHYEWIIVLKGKGKHHINDETYEYTAGDIFFLKPNDAHFFEFTSPTHLVYFQFSVDLKIFKHELSLKKKMFSILKIHEKENAGNLKSHFQSSDILLEQVALITKMIKKSVADKDYIKYQLFTFLSFIVSKDTSIEEQNDTLNEIIIFIRSHIKNRKYLTIDFLADHFNKSPTYFGEYFKKGMGISVKKYIDLLRSSYLEKDLIYSKKSLSELSYDYQFTDLSHLNKFIIKHFNKSPKQIRENKKY
ncbi:AraC family ligand binding domain-containing protein [Flammeovirga pacifica]|uniref:HTH araC/xylS-type domain-containing protein n=1 Tax=Flammeovirga pacifica TaxID=915059 RepID=A0A1S1YYN5_FLAPC|nr:AraC family ligand binding domain-containing protein [Flammeovirga pacifica]OHX66124.1 hypothetical protein NH26_07055 [Flammeovirga pacifica]